MVGAAVSEWRVAGCFAGTTGATAGTRAFEHAENRKNRKNRKDAENAENAENAEKAEHGEHADNRQNHVDPVTATAPAARSRNQCGTQLATLASTRAAMRHRAERATGANQERHHATTISRRAGRP
ncbi:hypothetical protein KDX05_30255 [Burkholderia vietnamiensis]|uniref:hypothetical protein n=1 Tax=Burkholderia vietnamiensis TaxID=60552 RepID=UPI001B8F1469|nr:hypothetical protein [Burkholderia vietnamiensis]MBR8232581.1 hypothetical protein [Burkholderia vietnamiensis]